MNDASACEMTLREIPMAKAEWDSLNSEFILPVKLVKDTTSASLYFNAAAEIQRMKSGNLLFRRSLYSNADNATKKICLHQSITTSGSVPCSMGL